MERRNFISTVGTVLGSSVVASTTAVASNPSSTDAETLGEEILTAYSESGKRGVAQVYEQREIPYAIGVAEPEYDIPERIQATNDEEGEIQPNFRYSEDESELVVALGDHPSSNRIWATTLAKLRNPKFRYRSSVSTPDAIGISFNGSHWSVVGDTYKNFHSSNDERNGDISWHSQSLSDGGLAAQVDLPRKDGVWDHQLPNWVNTLVQTELENLDGVAGNIFGTYVHNGGGGNIQSVSGGAGPISVELSGFGSTTWMDMAKPKDADPFI